MTTTTAQEIDSAIAALRLGEIEWSRTPLRGRRELLEQIHAATAEFARDWVEIAAGIKGLAADSPLLGEEWVSGPYSLLTGAAALAESLAALEDGGSPVDGYRMRAAPGNRTAVDVFPASGFDRLLLNGFSAQVWSKPAVDAATVRARAGLGQRTPERTGGIAVVLGAGNIFSIAPLDVLYQLYADNRVVVLKLNPITDPLLPVFEKIFAPAIARGFVRIVTGGADIGTALVHHPDVESVHMTGSALTHDAIVFGAGADGAERKAARNPLLHKPITSELGGVSPTVVVPGRWSRADLRFQAEHLATQRLHNNGYNCVAAQVAVIGADWPQKQQFLDELRAAMHRAPARTAYYPGSAQRVAAARAEYPEAHKLGAHGERTLITGLAPTKSEPALHTEYFAPVLGVIEIPGTAAEFLAEAVRVCNDEFEGTLGVNIIAHPRTMKSLGAEFDTAVATLRYGTVAINAWTGLGYLTARASWGAFPGHSIHDVQSGIGVVHNALLIADPERTVVRGPFRPSPRSVLHGEFTLSPKPPWFVTNRTGATTLRRLTDFAKKPRVFALPGIFASALRG
ncbi:aldehyde dehydrogenase (NAD(P)+) [Nocardia amikacinitolerans]|uniref:aldehyde dehydrogenase family protein n=1 Tax=Nocardia amikacinitolerans TaxID=756689 RepID=UPI0020A3E10E|nr:aldehyde dehydrogenase family protein [Nocardia amikacinitolerans]MCP2296629.1 aldehyde dehydrogenase (NAD(P)+) [Nocardia amikacinitolerans]